MNDIETPVALALVICTAVVVLAVVLMGRKLSVKVGKIHAEFSPNGGSSLRDSVDKIRKVQDEHTTTLADHTTRLVTLENPPPSAPINVAVVNPTPVPPSEGAA